MGRGGGEVTWAMPERKHSFFKILNTMPWTVVPLTMFFTKSLEEKNNSTTPEQELGAEGHFELQVLG